MELVAFCSSWLVIGEGAWNHDLVDHDSVVVDLGEAVRLFQEVEADFVIKWYVVSFSGACNSNDNVLDSGVAMHETNVVVEEESIQNQRKELDQEGDEKPNEA